MSKSKIIGLKLEDETIDIGAESSDNGIVEKIVFKRDFGSVCGNHHYTGPCYIIEISNGENLIVPQDSVEAIKVLDIKKAAASSRAEVGVGTTGE